jgi:RNA polymerase sigma-70 factor, ECF subfamily
VSAAQAGDRDALDSLLRRHHERLWRLCRRMAGNDADAQDALQEAMIAIARGIRRFDGRAAFTTWSYRVATNACLDELRRRRRRPIPGAIGASGDAEPGGSATPSPLSSPFRVGDGEAAGLGPGADGNAAAVDPVATVGGSRPAGAAGVWMQPPDDRLVDAVADRLDVDAGLAQLPDEFRAAVVLRDICDLDYAEIARVLDVPVGTVRSRIARGRARLADLIGNPEGSPDRPTTSR